MRILRYAIFAAAGLSCAAAALASDERESVFSDFEAGHIERALQAMNMSAGDMGFSKDVAEPRWSIPWIRRALTEPQVLWSETAALERAAREASADAVWSTALRQVGAVDAPSLDVEPSGETGAWEGLDATLAGALVTFLAEARRANALLDLAFRDLPPDAQRDLAAAILAGMWNAEDEEATRRAILDAGVDEARLNAAIERGRQLDEAPAATFLLDLAVKIDANALFHAGRVFERAVAQLAESARGVETWPEGNLVLLTDLGRIRIVGDGNDTYTDRALLVLTRRGHQTYDGDAGVANALAGQRLAAVIDLEGNDTYRCGGLFGAGTALFGVSVVVDAGGDDVWRAAYAGQAASIFGVAWVDERHGSDDYEARALAQAATIGGIAVLADRSGADVYAVGLQGQGYAALPSWALLLDSDGQDRYLAGGREPDHERHPDRYVSLAQGIGIGMRPWAGGGVGAIADLAGNDVWVADVFGQGAGYYYSAGFLLEGEGHDSYVVHHYGQGAGIHLSHGLLVDSAGDDTYRGGILAQGVAHDYAVGLLLDREGRDTYIADRDSQGHGMNNSLALLVDSAGDDRYVARDISNSQGIGNTGFPRNYGSLSMLVDLGGRDGYSCDAADGSTLLRQLYGVVYDREATNAP